VKFGVRIIKGDAHAFKILFVSKPIPIWITVSNFEVMSVTFIADGIHFMARQPLVSHVLLMSEVPRSHSDIQHSVGLLWASDRPVAETST